MDINDLVKQAHETACEKGWWDSPREPLEIHMLIVSEIAEATEAVRRGDYDGQKEELADAIIRIMDYFGLHEDWNLEESLKTKMEYNKTRPYKHGKLL